MREVLPAEGDGGYNRTVIRRLPLTAPLLCLLAACPEDTSQDHGPIAENVSAALGEPVPYASPQQRAIFERGRDVAERRFDLREGLGPTFNVTFCASCHEKPTIGGSAGLYRNFFLSGYENEGGVFFPGLSNGMAGGVIRMFHYGDGPARPVVPDETTIFAQRNAIPFFGVGLLAELDGEEILSRADPEDIDGDGISGRANFEMGFVGRFGRKSQTASIEGFIRGPLFNHLGITTDPLTDEQRARLPVDSSSRETVVRGEIGLIALGQAAVGDEPTLDDDGVADPEMSTEDLFNLISFSMLLAAPKVEPPTPMSEAGRMRFDEAGCAKCHSPRLQSFRGPLPVYSDLLLHDMGPDLADGIVQKEASGSEFRTQPLWGLAAVGPYLHDGRAETIEDAILMHGGEGAAARDAFDALTRQERDELIEFLMSLGGRDQASGGLLKPGEPVAAVGEYGGPSRALDATETERFIEGRRMFDHEFGFKSGAGAPRFNGDSCRACHFEPVFGGAGPRGVNVMRHGIMNGSGAFTPPAVGTILHKETALRESHGIAAQPEANVFESRQTPHLFGLGLIDEIPDAVIMANADPDDLDKPDGISGRVSYTDDGRIGRFGWKAQVPSIAEFVRDAVAAELGMTLPFVESLTFGAIHDNDDVPDPEMSLEEAAAIEFYLGTLAPPPRQPANDAAKLAIGEQLFDSVGCASCHIPALDGPTGPVPLYSDLLLHEVLPEGAVGIEDTSANVREFRTAPLWGLSQTAPYLHNGAADTVSQAIVAHDGEAKASKEAFQGLSSGERAALVYFLETL